MDRCSALFAGFDGFFLSKVLNSSYFSKKMTRKRKIRKTIGIILSILSTGHLDLLRIAIESQSEIDPPAASAGRTQLGQNRAQIAPEHNAAARKLSLLLAP
jgi:hypothetical protein